MKNAARKPAQPPPKQRVLGQFRAIGWIAPDAFSPEEMAIKSPQLLPEEEQRGLNLTSPHCTPMTLAVELEFPAEKAATAIQALQRLSSSFVVRINGNLVKEPPLPFGAHLPELSEAEQRAMLAELSAPLPEGAETAEEMIARIYGDRRDAPREVEL